MTNRHDLLEHAVELFPAPDQALEHLKRRHRRQQRNRRLAAGALGLAIALVIVGGAYLATRSTETVPADPSLTPASTTAVKDGRVLFVIYHGHRSDPAYIDAAGVHPLGSYIAANFFHLVWASPTEIIYDGRGTGERHLYRMSIDGNDVTQLTHGPTSQQNPAVSPDGSTVVYEQYDEATNQELGLYVADATTGADPRPLFPSGGARTPGYDTSATFSPDGEWIAFVRASDAGEGAAALYIVRPDGTGLRRLVDEILRGRLPTVVAGWPHHPVHARWHVRRAGDRCGRRRCSTAAHGSRSGWRDSVRGRLVTRRDADRLQVLGVVDEFQRATDHQRGRKRRAHHLDRRGRLHRRDPRLGTIGRIRRCRARSERDPS